ncbi:MAG: tetratricopeptide repeat protein [Gemmataceae bacterium]|nr:tetratricopeptide repeat protein [Gemmataceae bacterium]
MRTLSVLLLFCSALPAASLKEARTRWLKGNYEEAAEEYADLVKDAKTRSPASVGLSRALQSQGEYDKAMTALDDALRDLPKDAPLLARKAELLHLRGKWAEAVKAADAALEADPRNVLAHWAKAQVLRDQGEIKKADAALKAVMRLYSSTVDTPKEIKDPDDLLVVALASAENARWNGLADEFQTIVDMMGKDALGAEKAFWPAELVIGQLMLEKYNRAEAIPAFDKALAINPSASEALVAKGMAALQRFEFKDAESFAERALKNNPRLPDALRLRADVHLATGDHAAASKELKRALQTNPRDEKALARLAASALLQQDKAGYEAVLADVSGFTKNPATFHAEVAEKAEERRRYDVAEKHYREAMRLRPELAGPVNGLGMLLLRLGQEKEGKERLDKGFKLDPFNVRVKNMRTVMNHLAKYKEEKTKHFIVRYDEKSDPVLAKYMGAQLEDIYEELAKKFDYRPEGPILVEVFRSHTMFSGRTVALPDLHTIGACTGRVITMVSPNERTPSGDKARSPFNWMRVIRHEIVHIFNLAQTTYLVPHWFTEGLAVANEGSTRPPSWSRMLADRVATGKLLDLDTIDLAFIRPRNPLEWQQAYLQANLYVEFIEKEYGKESIGKLLAAFAKGLSATAAIKDVLKAEKAAFEKKYKEFLGTVVEKERGGKKPEGKRKTLEELRAEQKKNPNDPDVAAELAYRIHETRRVEARKFAELALDQKKNHPKALYVLGELEARAANEKKRKEYLELAFDPDDPFPPVAKALGRLRYEANDLAGAAKAFEAGRKADPADPSFLADLQRVYAKQDDKAKLIAILKELVPTDYDNLDWRNRLARLLMESGKAAEAEEYARKALEIDVTSAAAKATLYKALEAQKKDDELAKMKAILGAEKEKKGKG